MPFSAPASMRPPAKRRKNTKDGEKDGENDGELQ